MTAIDYAREYEALHANAKYFQGFSIKSYVPTIAELVRRYQPKQMLDYASGKGHQYLVLRVHEQWGGLLPWCYDIGVRGLSAKPPWEFDGVICTDMLEHIAEPDVPGVLDDILASVSFTGFVFLAIACRPASEKRSLSDGRNLHLTVRPPGWWDAQIAAARKRVHKMCEIVAVYDERDE